MMTPSSNGNLANSSAIMASSTVSSGDSLAKLASHGLAEALRHIVAAKASRTLRGRIGKSMWFMTRRPAAAVAFCSALMASPWASIQARSGLPAGKKGSCGRSASKVSAVSA